MILRRLKKANGGVSQAEVCLFVGGRAPVLIVFRCGCKAQYLVLSSHRCASSHMRGQRIRRSISLE
jgi:hypothetical protein